ncbi:MAG: hypothetical protein EBT08_00825 [Betaproteobacteria bacterium]|nr:hypothetical protein [Betaproteobacteria bacterium]
MERVQQGFEAEDQVSGGGWSDIPRHGIVARLDDRFSPSYLPQMPEGAAFQNAFMRVCRPGINVSCLRLTDSLGRAIEVPASLVRAPLAGNLKRGLLSAATLGLSIPIAVIGDPSSAVSSLPLEFGAAHLFSAVKHLGQFASLICLKGLSQELNLRGFLRFESFPLARLRVTPDYWKRLSSKKRSDLNRHRRASSSLHRMETVGLPVELEAAVYGLYRQTQSRADFKFIELPTAYFRETSALSRYVFYFERETLIGFHQMLCTPNKMICKSLMLDCIDIAIREGIPEIDFGITSYRFKHYIGCDLVPMWNYFHHTNPLLHATLPLFRGLLTPSRQAMTR